MLELRILSTDDTPVAVVLTVPVAASRVVASSGAALRLDLDAVGALPVTERDSCSFHACWGDTAVRRTGAGAAEEEVLGRLRPSPSLPDAAVCVRLCMSHMCVGPAGYLRCFKAGPCFFQQLIRLQHPRSLHSTGMLYTAPRRPCDAQSYLSYIHVRASQPAMGSAGTGTKATKPNRKCQ